MHLDFELLRLTTARSARGRGIRVGHTRDAIVKFQKAKNLEANDMVEFRTSLGLRLDGLFHPLVGLSSLYPWMRVAH